MSDTAHFRPYTQKAPPDANLMRPLSGQVYVVEGGIGVGKSTLAARFAAYLTARGIKAAFLPEVFSHELLKEFIAYGRAHPGEKNIHAFAFQMSVLEARINTYQQALALQRDGTCVFVDRSLPGDYVFALTNYRAGNLSDGEWAQYLARMGEADLLAPTAVVYLKVSLDASRARIRERDRDGEEQYAPEYLHTILVTYDEVVATLPYPTLTLAWSRALDVSDNDIMDKHMRTLLLQLASMIGVDATAYTVSMSF
jgi:deoxyadenosine/deoxycytidine kinase